jgi:hypothetical protein
MSVRACERGEAPIASWNVELIAHKNVLARECEAYIGLFDLFGA